MSLQTITRDTSPRGIATITLNRPDRGNAFNATMLAELAGEIEAAGADANVRVLVLKGAGRHFCVGADIGPADARKTQDDAARAPSVKLIDLVIGLDTLPKPTVAVINGGCVGGGFAIASCCDTVLADEAAFFSIPEARLGFGASALLPVFVRAIGYRQFRRYGLSGERISATEALRMGFVHQIHNPTTLEGILSGLLDALLHAAPGSVKDFKAAAMQYAVPRLCDLPLADLEAKFDASRDSPEAREGLASFREKRKPAWYRAP
jgi:methylglutaconyl-CoA hydratase